MNQEKVGKFIAELRKVKGLTQTQLGEKLGVTDKTISKWEQGRSIPNVSYLQKLGKVLEVSATELLNGEKIKNANSKDIDKTIYTHLDFYARINKKKYIKKVKIGFALLVMFFLGIIVMLFLHNNYNNCYIYELKSNDNNFKIEGTAILTPEKDIITINSVENIEAYELDNEMVYSYEYLLKIKNEVIFKKGNISLYEYQPDDQLNSLNNILNQLNIYINEDSNYNSSIPKAIQNDLILKIRYINQEKLTKEIEVQINFNKLFSNNKIFYNGGKKF